MKCRDFEQAWNDLLDARSAGRSDLEQALELHASTCAPCRAISGRYSTLRQAIASLQPVPAPSRDLVCRVHALRVPPPSPRRRRDWVHWGQVGRLAAAAVILAIVWLGGNHGAPVLRPEPVVLNSRSPVTPARPLDRALAEMTEATIDLARDASAPAGRIGREMFDLGRSSTKAVTPPLLVTNSADPEIGEISNPSTVLESVGQRLSAGVKPISGSARHAFSFLLGSPPDEPPLPAPQGSL